MIQIEPEDVERIRARIRKMSDLELRQYGRAARDRCDDAGLRHALTGFALASGGIVAYRLFRRLLNG